MSWIILSQTGTYWAMMLQVGHLESGVQAQEACYTGAAGPAADLQTRQLCPGLEA